MKAPLLTKPVRNVSSRAGGSRVGEQCGMGSHKTGGQEDDGVDKSHNPLVSSCTTVDTKLLGEGQIGPVGSRLIPSLRGGAYGTQRNRVPEHLGTVPFVTALVYEGRALVFLELGNRLKSSGFTCDQGSPTEERGFISHAMRLGKSSGVGDGLLYGDALSGKRVSDNAIQYTMQFGLAACETQLSSAQLNRFNYLQRILNNVESDGLAARRVRVNWRLCGRILRLLIVGRVGRVRAGRKNLFFRHDSASGGLEGATEDEEKIRDHRIKGGGGRVCAAHI